MDTSEIAELLVRRCRESKYVEAITELYAPNVRQFENGVEVPGGRAAIEEACRAWVGSRTIHQNAILGKHVADDAIVLEMEYDVTPHDTKRRHQWREAAIYRVTDGKISEIRFYYKPPTP